MTDDLTPQQVIAAVIDEWQNDWQPNARMRPLSEVIIEDLVRRAYEEGNEGALRWLDPGTDEPYILDRIRARDAF